MVGSICRIAYSYRRQKLQTRCRTHGHRWPQLQPSSAARLQTDLTAFVTACPVAGKHKIIRKCNDATVVPYNLNTW